jgi:hypothetical protein
MNAPHMTLQIIFPDEAFSLTSPSYTTVHRTVVNLTPEMYVHVSCQMPLCCVSSRAERACERAGVGLEVVAKGC